MPVCGTTGPTIDRCHRRLDSARLAVSLWRMAHLCCFAIWHIHCERENTTHLRASRLSKGETMATTIRDYLVAMDLLRPLLPFLVLGTTAYFARRYVRALERRSHAQTEVNELRARVAQLEEGLETAERDVMRVQAAQDFAAQLLSSRIADAS